MIEIGVASKADISIRITHRLVLYALEAGECLFCVQIKEINVVYLGKIWEEMKA